jgi:hypothetical protein
VKKCIGVRGERESALRLTVVESQCEWQQDKMASRRLIFDVSLLIQVGVESGGIIRALRELAIWACSNRDDVVFVTYDKEGRLFHILDRPLAKRLFALPVKIDVSERADRSRMKAKLRDRLPLRLRRWALPSTPAGARSLRWNAGG